MITIIATITTYNCATKLHKCISSVIKSLSPVDGILIIGNDSTDDTKQAIKNISNNKRRYLWATFSLQNATHRPCTALRSITEPYVKWYNEILTA